MVGQLTRDIEDAFEAHWRRFGLYPGARLFDEDGVLWFESSISHLPYNAVIRSRIQGDPLMVAERIDARFRGRSVPYMWVLRPSDTPPELGTTLARLGLDVVEVAAGMDFDLRHWRRSSPAPSEFEIVEVIDDHQMSDYEELIRTYWSVPESDRDVIKVLNRHWSGPRNPGVRLVCYLNGQPVAKLFLNLTEVPSRASVFGVAVLPEARGKGIATAMMLEAMDRAWRAGALKIVLHSSSMARSLYLRMGFTEQCRLQVYATNAVFGTHHH